MSWTQSTGGLRPLNLLFQSECLAPSIDLSWFLETSLISDTAESTGKEERSGQENGSVMAGLTSTYYLKQRQAYRIIFGPKEMY